MSRSRSAGAQWVRFGGEMIREGVGGGERRESGEREISWS